MTTAECRATDVATIVPLDHVSGLRLFAAEMQRTLDLLRTLGDHDWAAQTECPDWDVWRMYLHVLGACESGASFRELGHQMLAARKYQRSHGGPQEAALSATQVAERLSLSPAMLIDRLKEATPRALSKRARLPAIIRSVKLPIDGPVVEKWTLGYLIDVIYLRDVWMHRVDAARATDSSIVLTPDHDGRIIADVVAEWARRHGQPFTLILTGPAGGSYCSRGGSGLPISMDAVDFCRTLAGRSIGDGLLATIVPF